MKAKDKENRVLPILFRHFSMRLIERYNVYITFEDYLQLNKIKYLQKQMYKKNDENRISITGFITIKGVKVKVVRSLKDKYLVTAVPLTNNKNEFKTFKEVLKP